MTATEIRRTIARMTGQPADRDTADRMAAALRGQLRTSLYTILAAAGLEGIRPRDSKAAMLQRLRNRLTAAIRARERAEV